MRRSKNYTYTLPPPARGWNVRERFGEMRDDEAAILDNWEPQGGSIQLRPGYENAASLPVDTLSGSAGTPKGVTSMASYQTADKSQIVASMVLDDGNSTGGSNYVYAVDPATGAVVPNDTEGSNFLNLGSRTFFAERFDDKLVLDIAGDSGQNLSIWDGIGTRTVFVSISGRTIGSADPSPCRMPLLHRGRVFYIRQNTQKFAYGKEPQTPSGEFEDFNLALVAPISGRLVGHTAISRDAGDGPDDYYAAFSSEGDIIVYAGNDPGDADSWTLVGVYKTSRPLLRPDGDFAAFTKIGGDTILLTEDGYLSLARTLANSTGSFRSPSLSDAITPEITRLVRVFGRVGWNVERFPSRDWIIVQTPDPVPSQHIYVVNLQAWFRTNYPAKFFLEHDGELYFGDIFNAVKRVKGLSDEGAQIRGVWHTAPTHAKSPATEKAWGYAVPLVSSNADILDISIKQGFDFGPAPPLDADISEGLQGPDWDAINWDESKWGATPTMHRRRYSLYGHSFRTSVALGVTGLGLDARCHGMQLGFDKAFA